MLKHHFLWHCSEGSGVLPRSLSGTIIFILLSASMLDIDYSHTIKFHYENCLWLKKKKKPPVQSSIPSLKVVFIWWLVNVGIQSLTSLPQTGTALKGHPTSRVPHMISWGLSCNFIAIQPFLLPKLLPLLLYIVCPRTLTNKVPEHICLSESFFQGIWSKRLSTKHSPRKQNLKWNVGAVLLVDQLAMKVLSLGLSGLVIASSML